MLRFTFARLHTDNPFHHAILSSSGSLNGLEPFAKTSLHTLHTLVKPDSLPFPEHSIKYLSSPCYVPGTVLCVLYT